MKTTLRAQVTELMDEGYRLWGKSPLPLPSEEERYAAAEALADVYEGEQAAALAAACQCFYLFRLLHGLADLYPDWATLLGDYFFSRFSKHLIPLDSVPLINAFSSYLSEDVKSRDGSGDYFAFVRGLPAVLAV